MPTHSYTTFGDHHLGGRAFVLYPQTFVPEVQLAVRANSASCGTTGNYCVSGSYKFCTGMVFKKGAYVPAVTVCQNLYLAVDDAA